MFICADKGAGAVLSPVEVNTIFTGFVRQRFPCLLNLFTPRVFCRKLSRGLKIPLHNWSPLREFARICVFLKARIFVSLYTEMIKKISKKSDFLITPPRAFARYCLFFMQYKAGEFSASMLIILEHIVTGTGRGKKNDVIRLGNCAYSSDGIGERVHK